LERAFRHVGINDWENYIETNPAFVRPAELHSLCGNPTKAEKVLGWQRKTDFDGLVKMMVEADVKRYGGTTELFLEPNWTTQTK
jgi:GDPmannose 4,6-dehydratase